MDKEKNREYQKKYRETHKEKIKEYQKKYWKEHGEEINAKRQNRKSYKVRCKRAIEYIEENTTIYYTNIEETNKEYELVCKPEDLLDILKGSDKEC